MAFSYSGHVNLYCSDKGENILHVHNLQVHFRLYSHKNEIDSVFRSWLVYLKLFCVRRIQIRDTVALFRIDTKCARSEIWYQIWKTLNFNKLEWLGTKPGKCLGIFLACLSLKPYLDNFDIKRVQISYLVNMCLQIMTINCITCWYGNVVTMATEACILNFAVLSSSDLTSCLVHRSLEPTVVRSQLVAMNTLFPGQHRHTILG